MLVFRNEQSMAFGQRLATDHGSNQAESTLRSVDKLDTIDVRHASLWLLTRPTSGLVKNVVTYQYLLVNFYPIEKKRWVFRPIYHTEIILALVEKGIP